MVHQCLVTRLFGFQKDLSGLVMQPLHSCCSTVAVPSRAVQESARDFLAGASTALHSRQFKLQDPRACSSPGLLVGLQDPGQSWPLGLSSCHHRVLSTQSRNIGPNTAPHAPSHGVAVGIPHLVPVGEPRKDSIVRISDLASIVFIL